MAPRRSLTPLDAPPEVSSGCAASAFRFWRQMHGPEVASTTQTRPREKVAFEVAPLSATIAENGSDVVCVRGHYFELATATSSDRDSGRRPPKNQKDAAE